MEVGVTYIICPNPKCKLFWDTTSYCPCEDRCPWAEKEKFVVLCPFCRDIIVLDSDYKLWQSVTHVCADNSHPFFFRKTHYHILYEMPTND